MSFASFDPYIATAQRDSVAAADISNLSLNEERCRPKRIVIENVPGKGSFWRWVPGARKQEGVVDEGSFPRLIELCGQRCVCSQDQWDIHKLDPLYDCYVKCPPALTVIVPKGSIAFTTPLPQTGVTPQGSLLDIQTEDEYDSERMIVDDDGTRSKSRFKKRRPSPREPLRFNISPVPPSPIREPQTKRRARVSFQSLRDDEDEEKVYFAEDKLKRNTNLYEFRNQKRTRTTSPEFCKRVINAHRLKHENMKRERSKQEADAKRAVRDQQFLRELLSDLNQEPFQCDGFGENETPQGTDGNYNSDAEGPHDQHEESIAASLQKMAELNKHRNMERDKERELYLQETARLDAHARSAAEERRLAQEAEEAKLRQEAEAQRRQREELIAKVERERQLRHEQWNVGPWSVARAIERYKITSVFFDKANFSEATFPLAFIDIPWPSLRHPSMNRPQDLDWDSTNEFFYSLKSCLRDQAFKNVVRQSLQRFHPDRWSGRNLFSAIVDEDERSEIETAVNMVSKAIGALYSELRTME